MTLENEIQSKFKNDKQKALVNILYTSNFFAFSLNFELKEFAISQQQYNVLRILRGQFPKPASVNLITERMLDKMSNASRLVEKLRQKEFIERVECPEDRRKVNVSITRKGLNLLEEAEAKLLNFESKINSLSDAELKTLNSLLDKIRD